MPSLVQTLSHLVLGQKGGENRILIIELLRKRPYNANQLAEALHLNYRTIKHHIDVLREHGLLVQSSSPGYGEVYFLSPDLEANYEMFKEIASKLKNKGSSYAFLHNVFEQTHDAVIVVDEVGQVIFWNKSAERLLGYSDKEILGKAIPIFNDPEFLRLAIKEVADNNEARVQEIVARDRSGTPIDLEINIGGVVDEEGQVVAYSILARDIGVRKRNEERLTYLNVLLTAVNDVNQSINREPDIVTLAQKAADRLDDTGLFIDVSIALRRDSDNKLIVLVGHTGVHNNEHWRMSPEGVGEGPNCVKSAARSRTTTVANGSGEDCAGCCRECDRGRHSTLTIPMKYRNDLMGILSVCFQPNHVIYKEETLLLEEISKDLTLARTKMLAESLLARNEEHLTSALLAARSGAWDWDLKTGVLTWSHGLERVFGFDRDDAVATHDALLDIIDIEDRQEVVESIDACLKGSGEHDLEYRVICPDSSIHWIHETGDVVLGQDGKPIRMLAVVRDITKRKPLENELSLVLEKAHANQNGAQSGL